MELAFKLTLRTKFRLKAQEEGHLQFGKQKDKLNRMKFKN